LGFKKKLVKLLGTIENLGKHLIFALLIFNFSFWLYSQQKRLVLLCFMRVVVISVFLGQFCDVPKVVMILMKI
jgi:hypothetical protein